MNICQEYAALLDLYVDGELEPEEMVGLQAHLEQCPACRAYVDDAFAIRAAFPDGEDTVLPKGFHASVMAAVAADAAAEASKATDANAIDVKAADDKASRAKKRRRGAWTSMLPLAAACFALVLLVEGGVMDTGKNSAAQVAGYSMSVERAAQAPAMPEAPRAAAAADTQAAAAASAPAGFAENALAEEADAKEAPAAGAGAVPEEAPAPAAEGATVPGFYKVSGTAAAKEADDAGAPGDYFAVVYLTGDAARADALAGLTPVTLRDGSRGYELSRTECEALLRELAARGIRPETEEFDTASETALAVVEE